MEEAVSIKNNIDQIRSELPEGVRLVAVTKYHSVEETEEVIRCGVDTIAENKVQDLLRKQEIIKTPVTWHFIGHLQQNKVRQLVGRPRPASTISGTFRRSRSICMA